MNKRKSMWLSWLCLFLLIKVLMLSNNNVFDMCQWRINYFQLQDIGRKQCKDILENLCQIFFQWTNVYLFHSGKKRTQHRTQEYKINTHHSSQTFFLYVLLFCTVLLRKVYFSFLLSSSWDLFHIQCVIGSQDFIMRYQRKEISGCSALIFKMYATT